MDPVSAFALSAGVLQVIGFAMEVVRTGKQIHEAGSTALHADLEMIGVDLVSAIGLLKDGLYQSVITPGSSSSSLSREDQVVPIRHTHTPPMLFNRYDRYSGPFK